MNDRLAASLDPQVTHLRDLFEAQQRAFLAAPYPTADERRAKLRGLRKQLHRYQDLLAETLSKDFGFRSENESKMVDILGSTLDINHAISHLGRWMKAKRRSTELLFLSNSLRVRFQPKGVVGVIVPWNLPIYLALGPLSAALAAGNRVMIKMPEVLPATNAMFKRMLAECFAEDEVVVIGEELHNPNDFTALPFNHIVFTGSPQVGKIVMRTAAENLTPVTLELGGKSPAIVSRSYPLADAAKRIAHGKATNAGQVCVAPDYALVPRESQGAFVEAVKTSYNKLVSGNVNDSHDYTAVVNDRQLDRIKGLLDDAKAKGATIHECAEGGTNRKMPLHIVTGLTIDMRLMHEEVFGPILPVVAYDQVGEAIRHIQAGPRPLALYHFGHDVAEREEVLRNTHSGGVSLNDWGWQAFNHDAPFGGTGNSGMGNYHGEEGFRELSHARTIYKRHRLFPVDLFYPPYGTLVQRLTLRFFLGKADPTLRR